MAVQVVEGTTVDDAVNIMQEAHVNGLALVAQVAQVRGGCSSGAGGLLGVRVGCSPSRCSRLLTACACAAPCLLPPSAVQDKAELYCESLRLNGLVATIEPAGGGSGSGGEPSA